MDTYATALDLEERLSPGYVMPSEENALIMLRKASEVVDYATLGRAGRLWSATGSGSGDPVPGYTSERLARYREAITQATCDQVEFWLETGEEHDTLGLPKGSSLQGGRVQVQRMPGYLGQRARRTLLSAGLMWAGVSSG